MTNAFTRKQAADRLFSQRSAALKSKKIPLSLLREKVLYASCCKSVGLNELAAEAAREAFGICVRKSKKLLEAKGEKGLSTQNVMGLLAYMGDMYAIWAAFNLERAPNPPEMVQFFTDFEASLTSDINFEPAREAWEACEKNRQSLEKPLSAVHVSYLFGGMREELTIK